jgi:inorganic triphosphatase YgiF
MTRDTDYLEREIKFAADFGFELPDLRKVVGSTKRLPEQSHQTAYFDSPDYRLWQRGITLRHRTGDDAPGGRWTVKLPQRVAGVSLDRTELSWSGEREEIPAEAVRILAGVVRRATLERVIVLDSNRRRLVLHNPGGAIVGELDDDVVKVTQGNHQGEEVPPDRA